MCMDFIIDNWLYFLYSNNTLYASLDGEVISRCQYGNICITILMHLYRELSDKGGLVQRMIGLDGAFGRDQVLRRFNKDSELFPVCSI